jgi:GT2 family glycosyltransferase
MPDMSYVSTDVTIAIPTYGRDAILVDTIRYCHEQEPPAGECLILDQTPVHEPAVERQLADWDARGKIRWVRLATPSVPAAMNEALRLAEHPLVLYLDDDLIPAVGMVAAHAAAHESPRVGAVVGQIIQPWQTAGDVPIPPSRGKLRADFEFPFHTTRPAMLRNVMAGHMSVKVDAARSVGGFDENFVGAAYRFETEFGRRMLRAGYELHFEPRASIRHLRAERGGTRTEGNHLASPSPRHGVGDYYFALLHGPDRESWWYCARRLVREVCTRFHWKHPWYIPVKLIGELRALGWAIQLRRQGPKLMRQAGS